MVDLDIVTTNLRKHDNRRQRLVAFINVALSVSQATVLYISTYILLFSVPDPNPSLADDCSPAKTGPNEQTRHPIPSAVDIAQPFIRKQPSRPQIPQVKRQFPHRSGTRPSLPLTPQISLHTLSNPPNSLRRASDPPHNNFLPLPRLPHLSRPLPSPTRQTLHPSLHNKLLASREAKQPARRASSQRTT